MSKIINSGLDQYGAEPFEQQQFGTAGVERVKDYIALNYTRDNHSVTPSRNPATDNSVCTTCTFC